MNEAAVKALALARIEESTKVSQALLTDAGYLDSVVAAGRALADALRAGKKAMFFGNGGSAADAQHLAAELTGRFSAERRSLPGLALNCNVSSLTAIGNDYGFEEVFARQIAGLGVAGDIAIGISTSGNSANVLRALEAAGRKQITTVGLTGCGGKIAAVVDHSIRIPAESTPRIQEAHILTGHILCEIVERELFGDRG